MWDSGEYQDKQRFQYLLFPDGLVYDKKKGSCRTERIDSTFLGIIIKSQALANKKIGIPALGLRYSDLVEAADQKSNRLYLGIERLVSLNPYLPPI